VVIIIDELADLMMREGKNVEEPVVSLLRRLAPQGSTWCWHPAAVGERGHGLIKANFPSRIAFAMASQIDSRTILDMPGAKT